MCLISNYPDWHLPSPNSTPQSPTFGNFYFQSPQASEPSNCHSQHDWMTSQPSMHIVNAQTAFYNPVQGLDCLPSSSNGKRRRLDSVGHKAHDKTTKQSRQTSTTTVGYHQSSFPTPSFLGQFNGTTIQDRSYTQGTMAQSITPSVQMQTPPPTRDASSRRKPQQSKLVTAATASTIPSRRMSVPGNSWLKRPSGVSHIDASPFAYTPLQFSPSDPTQLLQTPTSGSVTAPAYPQSGLFWDPNSNHELAFSSFSTIADDPSNSPPQDAGTSFSHHLDMSSSNQQLSTFAIPVKPTLDFARPQSARPADVKRPGVCYDKVSSSFLDTSGSVNPSLLYTASDIDHNLLSRSNSLPTGTMMDDRQPYQYQIESLKREKELIRSRRTPKKQSRPGPGPLLANSALDLQRSLTDIRARQNQTHIPNLSQTSNMSEITHGLHQAHLPRNASPLKKQKSDAREKGGRNGRSSARKSIVLTVDAKGRAKTEVKTIKEDARLRVDEKRASHPPDFLDDSDSSDLPESALPSRSTSSMVSHTGPENSPARSDAQEALAEVMRDRQQRRLVSSGHPRTLGSNAPTYSMQAPTMMTEHQPYPAWNENSPTTITDPNLSPRTDITRCVCNNSMEDNGQLMLQW